MAKWASVAEVAEHLKIHEMTLYKKINRREGIGKLFTKRGPRLLADIEKVDEFLNQNELADHFKNCNNEEIRETLDLCIKAAYSSYDAAPSELDDVLEQNKASK